MVLIWWVSLFAMMAVSFFMGDLETPQEVRSISYEVLAGFLVSSISKNIHIYKNSKKIEEEKLSAVPDQHRAKKTKKTSQKEHLPL